ncbi:hypothetical protein NPX79_02815 [Spiroplasma endosymbiont of Anurida maritima]|uniref:hypothetical protein n=1 Tax=Spiroplasma endosymbiont of Anurida maritima TaxID=2967972 RepID=UPI0036D3EA68
MEKENFKDIKLLKKKAVNIYINEEILVLEEMYKEKFNQKPNRSQMYAAYLKQTLQEKNVNKSVCSCCDNDNSVIKCKNYIAKDSDGNNIIVCENCL